MFCDAEAHEKHGVKTLLRQKLLVETSISWTPRTNIWDSLQKVPRFWFEKRVICLKYSCISSNLIHLPGILKTRESYHLSVCPGSGPSGSCWGREMLNYGNWTWRPFASNPEGFSPVSLIHLFSTAEPSTPVYSAYLGQRGQQPLSVVQGGPTVGQTVGHVSQLLPDWREFDLDVVQASPVQLRPVLQVAEHCQSLAVQLLQGSARWSMMAQKQKPQTFTD